MSTAVLRKASGCAQCRFTGFSGRTAVSELLELDDSLRDLLVTRAAIVEVKRYVEQRQGTSLRAAAYALVAKGLTTMEEAQRVVGLALREVSSLSIVAPLARFPRTRALPTSPCAKTVMSSSYLQGYLARRKHHRGSYSWDRPSLNGQPWIGSPISGDAESGKLQLAPYC